MTIGKSPLLKDHNASLELIDFERKREIIPRITILDEFRKFKELKLAKIIAN